MSRLRVGLVIFVRSISLQHPRLFGEPEIYQVSGSIPVLVTAIALTSDGTSPPSADRIAEATLSSGTPTRFMNASDVVWLSALYAAAAPAPMVVPSMGRGNTARKRMPRFFALERFCA